MIPRIIHYCWFGGDEFGVLEKECFRSWEEVLPEYEIKLWNESTIDITKFPFASEAYQARKYAFVSDVVRLHALYEEGGIYLDTDVLVLKNFDDLLSNTLFTGAYKLNALNAAVIGAEKSNPIVKRLLEHYQSLEFNPRLPKTIPEVFDEILLNKVGEGVKIYPPEFFYPLPLDQKEEDYTSFLTPNSYCVHLWNHSWIDEFILLKQYRFCESVFFNIRNVIRYPSSYLKSSRQYQYFSEFYRRLKMYLHHSFYGSKKN